MNRRDFIKGILAAGMAPAFIRAESLMHVKPIKTNKKPLYVPDGFKEEILRLSEGIFTVYDTNGEIVCEGKQHELIATRAGVADRVAVPTNMGRIIMPLIVDNPIVTTGNTITLSHINLIEEI